jgi:ABC-2 type transport system ATP-binding protein
MKQRLAIARALLHDPPILCLDEPTRSLDPIAAKHLRSFVKEQLNRKQGKTILLATHNLQEAEEMCDRLAILNQGRVLRQGRIAEITAGLPGRDQYVLKVTGLEALPAGPGWSAAGEPTDGAAMHFDVAVDREGAVLSELLRGVLKAGGTIISCHRKEPSLQEVFDLIEPSGGSGGNA